MTLSKPVALLVALAAGIAVAAGVLVSLDVYTRRLWTPYEELVVRELATRGEPTAGVPRLIALGTSLGRNAIGQGPELEAALAAQGVPAEVINLAAAGTDLYVAEPAFDEILAARPDVLLLQIDMMADTPLRTRPDLRRRITTWMRGQHEPERFVFVCGIGQDDASLEGSIVNAEKLLTDVRLSTGPAERLIERAAAQGTAVVVYYPPISGPLTEATGDLRERFRADATAALVTGHPNVFTTAAVELPDLANYCDFSHLDADGQPAFHARFAPQLAELLKRIG